LRYKSRSRSLEQIDHKILRHSRAVEETLEGLLSLGRPLRVLEVGFGRGRALAELAWRFRESDVAFFGVDLERTKPITRSEDLRLVAAEFEIVPDGELERFRVPTLDFYDAQDLRFEDETLDLVYTAVTMRFMPRKADFLREVCRVLRPGGRGLLQVGESGWRYPQGPVSGDATVTPYRSRLVLVHGDELIPLPAYLELVGRDRFRLSCASQGRCTILIEKLAPGRLEMCLVKDERLSCPMGVLFTKSDGQPDDGYRSVYRVSDREHAAMLARGLIEPRSGGPAG